ncbi:MAG TPA: hypothetical protein PKJ43_06705 [Prolixibacteraceae bacterium]|mgnify:FL=1|jgi:hypothetical protein|nr:hypothetical protein [Prolixibacteraceae bacterium]
MKKIYALLVALVLTSVITSDLKAQFTAGVDLYSSYVWRGSKFAGPSVQPSVKFTTGGLTAGVWGSYDFSGYKETDPYISYSLPIGLSIGVTDYYYEGDITDFSDSTGSHALEVNLGYTIKGLSLAGNYIVNEAGGAASMGGDMYFQATYAFSSFSAFIGAGNGWHTSDSEFNVCNIGIQASKSIELTDKFSIPVTGQVIVNPDKKQLFMVVGLSF